MAQADQSKRQRRVTKRRPSKPRFDNSVASPCVAICTLDDAGLCIGCQRSADEIRDWMIMSREEKLQVYANIRIRKNNPHS